jgi:hypothetical protein
MSDLDRFHRHLKSYLHEFGIPECELQTTITEDGRLCVGIWDVDGSEFTHKGYFSPSLIKESDFNPRQVAFAIHKTWKHYREDPRQPE